MRARLAVLALGLAAVAVGATVDPRGWREGTPAAGTAAVIGGQEPVPVELPRELARLVTGPTLVVYFSPSCPHCVRVAPELGQLASRLAGRVKVIGVAAGGTSTPAILELFRREHGWAFEVLRDEERAIGSAIGAEGTPAVILLDRRGGAIVARDLWYPYAPGADALVELRLDPTVPFAPLRRGYAGTRACGACHTKELEAWLLSHHSIAWATLVRGGHDDDPACVGCHVTGHGQPGGWSGAPADAKLVDVGCEACHGPGGPHDGVPTKAEDTCAGCHDAKHSIAFSVAKGMPLIDHYRTVAMDDAALRTARQALVQGEAPRDLLAFGDGDRVGSAACAGCHAAEHAQWASSPHAHAMATLATAGAADDAACVRCHATARASGPPPATVDGYRLDESVGCEACHGPGGAHVRAGGGTDNIVGLGESCPVCVIEAVCTRCHTAAWDPDWNLDADLPRAGHHPPARPTTPVP